MCPRIYPVSPAPPGKRPWSCCGNGSTAARRRYDTGGIECPACRPGRGAAGDGRPHFPGNISPSRGQLPGPAAAGVLYPQRGRLHHPGVPAAAGPAGIAAKYPSPRAAPHLLRLPKPRKTVESLCPEGGAGFGRGYPADGAGGGILGAPAAGGSEIPAAVPKLWEGHPPAPEV